MKKRKWKLIWKIILNVIMLLSLTSCETSCTDQEQEALIVKNNSQVTVEVTAISMGNFTVGPQLVPSNQEEKLELRGFTYTVQVRAIDDWLTFAHAKRDQLKNAYVRNGLESDQVNQILADLAAINQKIKAYQAASGMKSCQGVAFPAPVTGLNVIPVRGTVRIEDGSVLHTVRIICVDPPSSAP
jgi:hypothetical protein